MNIEQLQETYDGFSEWVVRDFEGNPETFDFYGYKDEELPGIVSGDVVSVFAPDGTMTCIVVLGAGRNLVLKTPN